MQLLGMRFSYAQMLLVGIKSERVLDNQNEGPGK